MARVTNTTDRPIYANVEGVAYEFLPGGSMDVAPRTAMLLGEYKLSINRDAVEAELAAQSEASKVVGTDEPRVERVVSPSALHGTDVPPMPGDPTGESRSTSGAPYQAPAERTTTTAFVQTAAGPVPVPVATTSTTPPPAPEPDAATVAAESLRGAALDEVLRAAGLSTSGTVAAKQARYADYLRAQPEPGPSATALADLSRAAATAEPTSTTPPPAPEPAVPAEPVPTPEPMPTA